MTPSIAQSAWFSRSNLRNTFCCAAMLAAIGLAGCGNSCYAGFSNNGTGVVIITAGNPAPSCSLSQGMGKISVSASKLAVCETCPSASRVEHIFVTVRSIQLRPGHRTDADSAEGIELAPQLAREPRRIDLMGDSMPEILVENASIPAGSYHEVRLQFVSEPSARDDEIPSENTCREALRNCLILADGRVEPLGLANEAPELLIPLQSGESDSPVLLPDARMDLRLILQPQQMFASSGTGDLKWRNVLAGRATVVW